jgi:hypothetical protein
MSWFLRNLRLRQLNLLLLRQSRPRHLPQKHALSVASLLVSALVASNEMKG